MKKEDIHLGDWHRILIGDAPETFLVEVLVRTFVVYVFLLMVVKLLGKRMGAQVTFSEMSVILTLGAIIAPAFEMPDKGILVAMVILLCTIFFQRGLNSLGTRFRWLEEFVHGRERLLVRDGEIIEAELERTRISRNQLFAELRKKGIHHLGEVKRVYLEACGLFSVITADGPRAGLSIYPQADEGLHREEKLSFSGYVCQECGHTVGLGRVPHECPRCHQSIWSYPVGGDA